MVTVAVGARAAGRRTAGAEGTGAATTQSGAKPKADASRSIGDLRAKTKAERIEGAAQMAARPSQIRPIPTNGSRDFAPLGPHPTGNLDPPQSGGLKPTRELVGFGASGVLAVGRLYLDKEVQVFSAGWSCSRRRSRSCKKCQ